MENKQPSIVPGVLAVVGLVADAIGIFTFLKMGGNQPGTTPRLFYPIFELILVYSGTVFTWYSLNRIGKTFTDFDGNDPEWWRPAISPFLFTVITLPLQFVVFDTLLGAFFIQIGIGFFIALSGHLLYLWQRLS